MESMLHRSFIATIIFVSSNSDSLTEILRVGRTVMFTIILLLMGYTRQDNGKLLDLVIDASFNLCPVLSIIVMQIAPRRLTLLLTSGTAFLESRAGRPVNIREREGWIEPCLAASTGEKPMNSLPKGF